MPQHHRLVDLRLAEPRALLAAREDLHRHILAAPPAAPHLPEPALADHLDQLDLARNRTLHQQRQSRRPRTGRGHLDDVVNGVAVENRIAHGVVVHELAARGARVQRLALVVRPVGGQQQHADEQRAAADHGDQFERAETRLRQMLCVCVCVCDEINSLDWTLCCAKVWQARYIIHIYSTEQVD